LPPLKEGYRKKIIECKNLNIEANSNMCTKVILKGHEVQASWSQHFLVIGYDVLIGC
jgi:hypothetical protein